MTILVAGATGYLGGFVVGELQRRGMGFRVVVRNASKIDRSTVPPSEIIEAQLTDAQSLRGCCDGIDTIISTVGITRQRDGLTYMDVDYQANSNLLKEAIGSEVRKFIFVSALKGDELRHLKIFQAKEKFVDELKSSGLEYSVIRPNGFFSDMRDFLEMAKRGRVYLFGSGSQKLNPIHGADLAEVCIDACSYMDSEIMVGGPDVLSHNEIAEIALRANGREVRITYLPDWVRRLFLWTARRFTSSKTYGPIEFFLTVMASDLIAPPYGSHTLAEFFDSCVAQEAGRRKGD